MKKTWMALCLVVGMLCAAVVPAYASEPVGDGVLIYQETFDDRTELADTDKTLEELGWVAQSKAEAAYTNPTANLGIVDGRLQVGNTGNDSYYLMLDEDEMAAYDGLTITIQYDVEYTTAANSSRYICILANYNGQSYNSFHFRNRGDGNNQAHIGGSWLTYDAINPATDLYAPANDTGNGTSIAMRLLGTPVDANASAFSGVPVTIRYVLDVEKGPSVYMKLAEQDESEFVCVSAPDSSAEMQVYRTWIANAICFKVGGAQDGYVDNIAVWTGDGDFPKPEPEVTEPTEEAPAEPGEPTEGTTETPEESEPEKVKEPHTIVNKVAVWAVALFGGWVILKKEKERE